jgi:outer membrane protein, heavy metal efflux system
MQTRSLWIAVGATLTGVGAMLPGTPPYGQEAPAAEPLTSSSLFDVVDDTTLVRLVADALRDHPQMRAAEANLEREQALARAASRPLFNPELELDLESSGVDDRTLRLTQTLDLAGRRHARTQVADREVDATRQIVALNRRDLAVELLSTLAAYWTGGAHVALAEQRLTLLQRVADVAEQRARVGDVTETDVNLTNLARAQAGMELATAEADLASAEQALEALVQSEPANAWPVLPTELPEIDADRTELARLVTGLPEVSLQRQALAVAAAEVDLRRRERRPTPSISVTGGEEDDETLIGLSFSVPLNMRNRFASEVEAAGAEQRRAQREVENITLRALAAAESATARYRLIRDAWLVWLGAGALDLTQQTELLERLWGAGELSLTDYLVQLNQTLDTQRSAVELRRQLWDAWFAWLAATGRTGHWLGLPIEQTVTLNR